MKHFLLKLGSGLFILALVFGTLNFSYAQKTGYEKKMKKVYDHLRKNELDKASEKLNKVLEENPRYGKGWDLLAKIELQRYEDSKRYSGVLNMDNIKIEVTSEEGADSVDKAESDSIVNSLQELFKQIDPAKMRKEEYINALRKGTFYADDAYYCSMLARAEFVEVMVDTNVSPKAIKYYRTAEKHFIDKNFKKAATFYLRATEKDPDFFKARLYLGDSYFFLGDYPYAIKIFNECHERFPHKMEPVKYLADAYNKEGLHDKAREACVKSFLIYPDLSMFTKHEDAAYLGGYDVDIQRIYRGVFPNQIDDTTVSFTLESSKLTVEEVEAPGDWAHYIRAKDKIKDFCDAKGMVVKPNDLTKSQYLEVYSWENLIANSSDPIFDEAKRMQMDGYLDCYVLISHFHHDFYDQYAHFAANNPDKVKTYFDKYLKSR